jgi:hypothetical protein
MIPVKRLFGIVIITLFICNYILAIPVSSEDPVWQEASDGLPTSDSYFGVTFGDINNDGNLDIAAASDGKGIGVFLGDGAGTWSAPSSQPATTGGYGDITLGDYDSDGNLDIFAGSPGNRESSPTGLHVFKGDGTGGFSQVPSSTTTLPTNGRWRGVAVGDVNQDGNLDLAATAGYHTSDGLHVYLGDGTGVFTDSSLGLPVDEDRGSAVVLSDFNNDGILDVAAGGPNQVSVYLCNLGGTGAMTWTDSSTGLPSQRFTGISSVDLNNDGLNDLLLSSYNAGSGVGLRAYRNNNNAASWTSISANLPDSGDYLDIAGGDFDGDGNQDIVSGGVYGTKGIKLYLGDGTGTWVESVQGLSSTRERVGVDVGDFNSDGNLDLVFGRYDNAGVEVWENLPGDSGPPVVISTDPENSDSDIILDTVITITFSRAMDRTPTENALSISPGTITQRQWDSSGKQLRLSVDFEKKTSYTVFISNDAKDTQGTNLANSHTFTFTTGSSESSDSQDESDSTMIIMLLIPIIVVVLVIIILISKKKN